MDAQYWDELYGSRDQLFSGAPNGVLVAEAGELPPGRALDVGCGEGGDAIWLARRGWQVTGIDISRTALRRAAAAAAAADGDGVDGAGHADGAGGSNVVDRVTWTHADLSVAPPPPADAFDLVSVQYFPLWHEPEHTALRGLLAAVARGGTLLFVGHDVTDFTPDDGHRFDPADLYQPGEVAGLLGDDWEIAVNGTRPRTVPAPEGTHHTHDVVLRAQRLR
ncbi:methyltransferase domain-containing protein [Streptomyces oryzae]|uniref:Methyltransferase domain-containing protein n=1 Tax=Streptomyces oryzae TaxID=1434886 RepID=A0ABS3XEY3_9ACTN|nr:class I SAM-dependent methyltransferase [Streptomyces oryzae]MBO8193898.1 methyltransferase domain-containing protein [Streptomyces oryzae]